MTIKSMTVIELKEKLDQRDEFVLVDCRAQQDWSFEHIEHSISLPAMEIAQKLEQVLTDKNAPIIIQCWIGQTSMKVAHYLKDQGYTNLTNLEGGIMNWKNQGLPVMQGSNK